MAQYDTPYTASPNDPSDRTRKWPLAGVMAIDFVIAIGAFVLLNLLVPAIFIGIHMAQQGLSVTDIQRTMRDQTQALRLIGADGLFVTLLGTNLVFVLIPILRVKVIRRESLAELGFRATRPLRLVLIGIAVGVVSLLVNAVIGGLFQAYGIRPDQSAQYPLFQGDYTGQILFLIGAAVFAPIGEEVLFRGYVFNALRQTFVERPWGVPLAYVASAALFSIVHSFAVSQGLIGLLVPLFVIGLLLGWAMQATGSLIPSIIAHAINNGIALVVLLATCAGDPTLAGCPKL